MIQDATAALHNVKVEAFEGLLADFARQKQAEVLFRGLRNQLDYEQEAMLATVNLSLIHIYGGQGRRRCGHLLLSGHTEYGNYRNSGGFPGGVYRMGGE